MPPIVVDDRTRCQCLGLHLEVDFGIAVGRFEGDVTEPRSDRIDVHASAKEVDGRGVPHRMRADSFDVERGHPYGRPGDGTFDDRGNAEPGQALTAHVEKHRALSWPIQTTAE